VSKLVDRPPFLSFSCSIGFFFFPPPFLSRLAKLFKVHGDLALRYYPPLFSLRVSFFLFLSFSSPFFRGDANAGSMSWRRRGGAGGGRGVSCLLLFSFFLVPDLSFSFPFFPSMPGAPAVAEH